MTPRYQEAAIAQWISGVLSSRLLPRSVAMTLLGDV